ncbi:MAG: hypothetical protein IKK57_13370 [Clostridia bacterium]|nr:hypothetical protein [Clostridia bacterium]
MNKSPAACRIQARQLAEGRARLCLAEVVCTVSILRTGMTCVLPLAGSAAWWVTLAALLPGAGAFLLACWLMRREGAATLTELVRRRLGRAGVWALCGLLAALLAVDAVATLTALTDFFSRGVGTKGTPLTLSLLTGAALLPCLHRDGLPRAAFLLRWPLLTAALLAGAFLLTQARADHLFPLIGSGLPSVWSALTAGGSMGWPLLLLTLSPQPAAVRHGALARVALGSLTPLLLICLTIPQEILPTHADVAAALLLPGRYASPGVQMLLHCLLLAALFLALGGALHSLAELVRAPLSRPLTWLPHAALLLLILTQLLPRTPLRGAMAATTAWALLPVLLLLLLTVPRRRHRP